MSEKSGVDVSQINTDTVILVMDLENRGRIVLDLF